MSDNKSQSIDRDTSSIPGHTESDCDDSSEVFYDSPRNDTMPLGQKIRCDSYRCPHCDNAGGHSGHPSTKCPECGRWSAPPWPTDASITTSPDDSGAPVSVSITFDLGDTWAERRLREMLDAGRMKLALWEFDRYLHDLIKYEPDKPDAVIDELEMVRKALWNILDYQGIRLDEE